MFEYFRKSKISSQKKKKKKTLNFFLNIKINRKEKYSRAKNTGSIVVFCIGIKTISSSFLFYPNYFQ